VRYLESEHAQSTIPTNGHKKSRSNERLFMELVELAGVHF